MHSRELHRASFALALVAIGAALLAGACSSPAKSPPGGSVGAKTPLPAGAPADPVGPAPAGAKECDADADCASGENCFAPDFHPGRGTAPQCESDAHCGDGMVCDGGDCVGKCSGESCGPTARCNSDGHCSPRRCDEPGMQPCATNFRCDGTSGACARIACASPADCDGGSCWRGSCYAHRGFCEPQAYCCPP